MEILSFDISGKFAHFRKFYSSSTALSFSLPPRTTIIGILAAILGRDKDSYYEEFSSDKIRIGISIRSKIKKSFHRLNHLKVESIRDFRGNKLHIQTPFEVITPEKLAKEFIIYRVFVSYFGNDKSLFDEIKNAIAESKNKYTVTLGVASFFASINNYKLLSNDRITEKEVENEIITFNSAVNSDNVVKIIYDKESMPEFMIEDEILPADYKADFDREVIKMNKVLFIDGGADLKVQFTGKYYSIIDNKNIFNIQFLE